MANISKTFESLIQHKGLIGAGNIAVDFEKFLISITSDNPTSLTALTNYKNLAVDLLGYAGSGPAVFSAAASFSADVTLYADNQTPELSNSVQNFPLISVQFFPLFRSAEHGFCGT